MWWRDAYGYGSDDIVSAYDDADACDGVRVESDAAREHDDACAHDGGNTDDVCDDVYVYDYDHYDGATYDA